MKKKVVFLYTELAAYFISCVKELSHVNLEIHIVRYPVNAEAPFEFKDFAGITLHERKSFDGGTLPNWIEKLDPCLVLVSGWIDKDYLKVCDSLHRRIPVVLLMDNQWKGTWKQRLALLLDPYKLKKRFSHVWVPGNPQKNYAIRMGFSEENIRTGFYSADTDLFNGYFQKRRFDSTYKLLYIGRYLKFKGIFDLWRAFEELSPEFPQWELICIGNGEEWANRLIHPKINHVGFVQPENLEEYILNASFFVMPSEIEPWGVVMHEMAAAGLPIIATSEVGASTAFLEDGKNGFLIPAKNQNALINALRAAMKVKDDQYQKMSRHSHELASKISPAKWSNTLLNLMEDSLLSKND
jgi:glycosyltransferase involved in cell wall biosynthesis